MRIATIAANLSALAYGNAPGLPVSLAFHEFDRAPDGRLAHVIDGKLRALVPPEGMRDYAEAWPDCRPLVEQLLNVPQPGADLSAADAPGA